MMALHPKIMVGEVRHRLENTGLYFGHGASLGEGLWKTERIPGT